MSDELAALRHENAKLRRINEVLMDRVERSMDYQGNAFSLFHTAILLESKVRERTRELEAANQLAEETRSFLREAIDSISEGFILCDAEDRVALTNDNYRSMWMAGIGALEGPLLYEELLRRAALSGAVQDAQDDPEGWVAWRLVCHRSPGEPVVVRMADGRWFQISERRTRDGGIVGLHTDITELKQSEERRFEERAQSLRQAKLAADEANQSKTRFLAAASHDLLQPLNAARVFASALIDCRLPPKSRSLADSTLAALDSVDELLTTLLDISKLDAGMQPIARADFALGPLLATLAEEYALQAQAKGLRLTVMPSSLGLRSDPKLFGRILRNYLSNAIRYTPPGGRVLLGCRRQGDNLLVGVWDSGPGIPTDKLDEIFEEFRRLTPKEDAEQGRGRGMGLGLAIVRRAANMLDHRVVVRSSLGKGSLFAVQVPRAAPMAVPVPETVTPPAAVARLDGALVAIIDNDRDILDGMRSLIEGWGCQAVTGATADAVLAQLERSPDIILADFHLDEGAIGTDAVALLRRAAAAELPAVIITADYSPEIQDLCTETGCHLLTKPVRRAKLRSLVAHLLADRA